MPTKISTALITDVYQACSKSLPVALAYLGGDTDKIIVQDRKNLEEIMQYRNLHLADAYVDRVEGVQRQLMPESDEGTKSKSKKNSIIVDDDTKIVLKEYLPKIQGHILSIIGMCESMQREAKAAMRGSVQVEQIGCISYVSRKAELVNDKLSEIAKQISTQTAAGTPAPRSKEKE